MIPVAGLFTGVKPSDGPCKTYGRVDGLRVGYVSKHPADAACIIRVLSPDVFQVPYAYTQPRTVSGHKRLKVRVLDGDWE